MLEGTLDDFTLPDVLRLVATARRTGCLDVSTDCGAGRLRFRDGALADAAPGYDRRRPAETPEAAIEDLAFDLMRWDGGGFRWEAAAADGPAGASVDVAHLLAAVTRRLEELDEVRTLVPSERAVLTWAPQPPEDAVQINITPSEWRVLVLVDGDRTVGGIAAAAGLDDVDAMKVLFGLAAAGLVEVAGAPPPPVGLPERVTDTADMTDMTDMTAVSAVSDTTAEEHGPEEHEPADPFLAGLVVDAPAPVPDAVLCGIPAEDPPTVDRSTAARELAGLFDFGEPSRTFATAAVAPAPPPLPRRVEDDDQVTRGLISRLIDGVKGL